MHKKRRLLRVQTCCSTQRYHQMGMTTAVSFPLVTTLLAACSRYSPLSRTRLLYAGIRLYDDLSLVCTTYTEGSRVDLSLHPFSAEARVLSCLGKHTAAINYYFVLLLLLLLLPLEHCAGLRCIFCFCNDGLRRVVGSAGVGESRWQVVLEEALRPQCADVRNCHGSSDGHSQSPGRTHGTEGMLGSLLYFRAGLVRTHDGL